MRSTGDTGAFGELTVACDLLKRGYEVFRSVSPSSSFDLVVKISHSLLRVEVTTACIGRGTGMLYLPQQKLKESARWDLLAICRPDGRVQYFQVIQHVLSEITGDLDESLAKPF